MSKRSAAARNRRRRIKRRFARQKAKVLPIKDTRGILTQPETQPSSARSMEINSFDFSIPAPSSMESDTDIDRWSASSPPSSDKEDGDGRWRFLCMERTIVEDQRRSIQVHLIPHSEKFRGLEILKLCSRARRKRTLN